MQELVAHRSRAGCSTSTPSRSASRAFVRPRNRVPLCATRATKGFEFGFARGFEDEYEVTSLIGKGTFGEVYKCVNRETGSTYAVKRIKKRFENGVLTAPFLKRVQHEVDIYNHLGHSLNVAYLHNVYETTSRVDLVMEECSGGELTSRMRSHDYTERDAARFLRDVLRVLAQCHAKGIIVRDVKPENFLFSDRSRDADIKAIDFGMATYCHPGDVLTDRAGTPLFVAPEVLKMRYSQSADLWSAGVIGYLLIAGRLPFSGEEGLGASSATAASLYGHTFSNKDVFRAILYSDLDFESPPWGKVSPEARSLVQSLLQRDAAARPTAVEALRNPWLAPDYVASSGEGGAEPPLPDGVLQRLQRFGTAGRLARVGRKLMAASIPPDDAQAAAARAQFESAGGHSGRLTCEALGAQLAAANVSVSPEEVAQLVEGADCDDKGALDANEWLAAMLDWGELQARPEWQGWVSAAFEACDWDGSGEIGVADLTRVLCGEEHCPVEDTVPATLREAEKGADGSITFEEFQAMLQQTHEDTLELYPSRRRKAVDAVETPWLT